MTEGSDSSHQGAGQHHYAGAALLLRGEQDLANYNAWVAGLFVRHAASQAGTMPARVLDFGAGIGTLSRLFEARTGLRPETVELDPGQRAVCEQRGFKVHESLYESGGDYDLIFSSNVLEHIEDDRAVLATLRHCLAPGGRLIIYVPAFALIWTSLDDRVGHYRRYTRADLARKLVEAGLRVEHSRYCDSLGFLLALIYRYIGNADGEPSSRSLRLYDRWVLPMSRRLDRLSARIFGKNVLVVATRVA